MGGDRSRVVVLALGFVVAMALAMFVLPWFELDLGAVRITIGMRGGHGLHRSLLDGAFWGTLVDAPLVLFQVGTRVARGVASVRLSRLGMLAGLGLAATALAAAYLVPPDVNPNAHGPEVESTFAPVLFVVGHLLGVLALHAATVETTADDVAPYKPVVVARPSGQRIPTSPIGPISPHDAARRALSFVVASGEVTRAGIDARREDGTQLLVLWRDVVGAVVRRLPDELDATTFMDLVSVKGSTLRILPSTRLTGISVAGQGDVRVRSLISYICTACPDVQLDPATRSFFDKGEPAAQLKDLAMLAAHDDRLR